MSEFENGHKELPPIGPDIVWGRPGLFQQLIFALFALTVWVVGRLLVSAKPGSFEAVMEWQQRVTGYFNFDRALPYLAYALLIAATLSFVFLILEAGIAVVKGEDIRIRLSRNDYLLPVTHHQKFNALAIIIVGSFLEEVLFRAYLFQALQPIWNNWIWAALLVSAIFALIHTNLQGLSASVWIFMTSMILIAVIVGTSSLLFAAAIHFFINFFNLFIIPKLFKAEL